jgi:hypothetical protein
MLHIKWYWIILVAAAVIGVALASRDRAPSNAPVDQDHPTHVHDRDK